MKMRLVTDPYYGVEIKKFGSDASYYLLQTHFDTRNEAIEFAMRIALNYLENMQMEISWRVTYCFNVPNDGWRSIVVTRNTDIVDWSIVKKGGESKQ